MIEGIRRLRKYVCLHTHENVSGPSNDFDNSARPLDVLTIADAIEREVEKLKAENAKLRAERDEWHRVAVSKQDIIDHIRDARDENAKLRELTKDACTVLRNHYNKEWFDGTVFAERMRELGIEVK